MQILTLRAMREWKLLFTARHLEFALHGATNYVNIFTRAAD